MARALWGPDGQLSETISKDAVTSETLYFDATTSSTTDPYAWIQSYEWDFEDGSPISRKGWVEHRYTQPGMYHVWLNVVDSRGRGAGRVVAVVTVRDELPPKQVEAVATFDGSTGTGPAPYTVYLDGTHSRSLVPGAWIVSCEWYFGDGSSAPNAGWTEHVYRTPGRYVVVLKATDSRGRVGYDFEYVTVD